MPARAICLMLLIMLLCLLPLSLLLIPLLIRLQSAGEYLWNHANGTMLREFLVDEYVGGTAGLSSPDIDGVFLDDGWGSGASHCCCYSFMTCADACCRCMCSC